MGIGDNLWASAVWHNKPKEGNLMICRNSRESPHLCSVEITQDVIKHRQKKLVVYGIRVYCMKNIVAEYRDITDDREKILALFSLLDGADLDPLHIDDVIEDFVDAMHFLP